jgi:hypothetical protein
VGAEVVDEDFAVDLGGVEQGAALPEEVGLFASPSTRRSISRPTQRLGFGADLLLELHQLAAAGFDGALGDFGVEFEGGCAFFVGVGEDAEPVDLASVMKASSSSKSASVSPGKPTMKLVRRTMPGTMRRAFSMILRKMSALPPRFMRLRTAGAGVLQRDVEVLGDVVVLGDGFEQARGDLVGVGVEEAQPAQAGERGEGVEQRGEAVFEPEVFAVAGGVLADEGDLADALGDEVFGFGDDRRHAARAELAAQLRDDAEAAGVVAAFGDLDVGRGARRGEDARGLVGVEVLGQGGGGAVPVLRGRSGLLFAEVAFGAGWFQLQVPQGLKPRQAGETGGVELTASSSGLRGGSAGGRRSGRSAGSTDEADVAGEDVEGRVVGGRGAG